MARYFFKRIDGLIEQDEVGSELFSLDEVRRQAVIFAGESLRDAPSRVGGGEGFAVEVTDNKGEVVFMVRVSTAG